MNPSLTPEEIQELAAGYVLGDLSSAEVEQFQGLLSGDPLLQAEVEMLQETLAMVPYGLEEQRPNGQLRSQILTAATEHLAVRNAEYGMGNGETRDVINKSKITKWPCPPLSRSLDWLTRRQTTALAASLLLALGLGTVRLLHPNKTLPTQVSHNAADLTVATSDWQGISHLLQDHRRSLSQATGPVDIASTQPDELLSKLSQVEPTFETTLAAMPLLPEPVGKLLGGSNCHLGNTEGLRLTYQLDTDQTLSVYQLEVGNDQFPEFPASQPSQSSYLTLHQPEGVNVVLWREEAYLYALVADMPAEKLQVLAQQI